MDEPNGTLRYRVERAERQLEELAKSRQEIDLAVMRTEMAAVRDEAIRAEKAASSVRATLVYFAVSVTISAVGFAITMLSVVR